jgi:hypothetical protein
MKYKDEILHFIAGFLICTITGFVTPLLGLFSGIASGGWKELYDRAHPGEHTFDGWDAYWTSVGSFVGYMWVMLWLS